MSIAAVSLHKDISYLPIDIIRPNIHQPRKIFDEKELEELSRSIVQYGVLQPIAVRIAKGYFYELISGERRLRAAKLAGLITIPAIVMDITQRDSAVLAMIENLQRKDLNYIEEAEGFLRLMEEYNFTQEMLAGRIGKSQSAVANKIRLLRLPESLRCILAENNLTERHARALLRLSNENEQLIILKRVVADKLTVAKTEELISKALSSGIEKLDKKKKSSKEKIKIKVKDIRIFSNTIKKNISVMENSGYQAQYEFFEDEGNYEFIIKIRQSE